MAGYGDDDGFEAWLEANGYEIASDLEPAALRQRGSAYVDGYYGLRFPGTPTGGYSQDRAWPRTGAEAWGVSIPSNEVPAAIIEASYLAAYQEDQSPGLLSYGSSPSARIKREKVGPLETEYFDDGSGSGRVAAPVFSAIEGLLAAFSSPVNCAAIFVV